MLESSCGYLIKDGQWLMLRRNRKQNDVNEGRWIGVGGKLEPGESMLQCMHREIFEETGLNALSLELRGIVYFTYTDHDAEKIYVYTCDSFEGSLKDCDEGTLQWINEDQILSLHLWDGDRIFLERILEGDHTTFCYQLSYDTEGTLIKAEEKEIEKK
ncbi:MAG: 8-oxo-dGTP diphosphatase [Solobacterium sp.]|jgi:8-oxo-dGTP diphosphatase|nr:8-oxo-dGTP diphosphatase [Solobacterium sp.]MCH4281794.1 8-oxo-dGTP diphosphatase [Solobacterium sp.]